VLAKVKAEFVAVTETGLVTELAAVPLLTVQVTPSLGAVLVESVGFNVTSRDLLLQFS